jgi:hypothetical protein
LDLISTARLNVNNRDSIPEGRQRRWFFHGGTMAECGGSPERGLACATAFGFGQFRAQIKAGVEGSSPRGFSPNGDHRKKVCGSKDSALALGNGGRELQGVVSTGSSPNRCGTMSASSSGSHRGPKHRQEAALCVGAAARV